MNNEKDSSPENLYDFDINFRLWHLVKRDTDSDGCTTWSPARWQNFILLSFGLLALVGVYILPAMHWAEIRENSIWILSVTGVLLIILFFPIIAMIGAGLSHWPRLKIDKYRRELRFYKNWYGRPVETLHVGNILQFKTEHLFDNSGSELTGPFMVIFAELDDGKKVGIAIEPSKQLIDELQSL